MMLSVIDISGHVYFICIANDTIIEIVQQGISHFGTSCTQSEYGIK